MTDQNKIADELKKLNRYFEDLKPFVKAVIDLQKPNKQFDELEKRFDDLKVLVDEIAGDESLVRNLRTDCIGKEVKLASAEDIIR